MPFFPPRGTHPVKAAIWTFTRVAGLSFVGAILLIIFAPHYHARDLVKNAKVSSNITGLMLVEASSRTYFEKFGYLPGDDPKPQDCGDEQCIAGNGNGVIDGAKSEHFISHLKRIVRDPHLTIYENFFVRAYAEESQISGQKLPKGIYFILSKDPEALEPSKTNYVANKIDMKLDDGIPNSGRIRLFANADCLEDEENEDDVCASVFYQTLLGELRGIK